MIRTRAAAFFTPGLSVALLLSLLSVDARAQATPFAGTIANTIKTASNVAGEQPLIQAWIDQAITQLTSDSADAQSKARDALLREALVNGQPTASAAYLDLYAQLLNDKLLPLAQNPNTNTRVRLNAAIVTHGVARAANNPRLAPTAIAFMNDKSEAVVLWGVKAGRSLVPAQFAPIGGAGGPKITDAIVAAAKAHPKGTIGGAIAVDAYDALTLDIATAKNIIAAMVGPVIPNVQDLMAFRVQQFRRGVPPEPGADRSGASFLVHGLVWPVQTPVQQATTMQLLSDLLSLAAEQALAANPADQRELISTVQRIASSISVAATNSGEKGIADAVKPLVELQRGASAKDVAQKVKAVFPAIQTSKTYGKTNPPPAVIGHEAAPPPASAPTTGPVVIPGASGLPPVVAAPVAPVAPATRPANPVAPKGATTPKPPPPPPPR